MLHVARTTRALSERCCGHLETIRYQNITEMAVAEILRIRLAVMASIEPSMISLIRRLTFRAGEIIDRKDATTTGDSGGLTYRTNYLSSD